MNSPVQILRIVEVQIHTAQAVGHCGCIRNRIPIRDTGRISRGRDHIAHGDREIIAKPFADRTGFDGSPKPEGRHLGILDGMPVLMQDDFGIFGVIHAAFAKAQHIMFVPGIGIIYPDLIDAHILGFHIDRARTLCQSPGFGCISALR